MDFLNTDILKVLKNSVGVRFQNMSPNDFEDFIAFLFKQNNYDVTQTPYSGDFGADLIIVKDGKKIAVQVKRYQVGNKVGVKDLNQLIGAKAFYQCEHTIIITTSNYSRQAIKLSQQVGMELWTWNQLFELISKTWLSGKDYYQFTEDDKNKPIHSIFDGLEIQLCRIKFAQNYNRLNCATLIEISIKNTGDENICLKILRVNYTTINEYTYSTRTKDARGFGEGNLYPGMNVTAMYLFKETDLNSIKNCDFIKLEMKINDLEQNCLLPIDDLFIQKNKSCYLEQLRIKELPDVNNEANNVVNRSISKNETEEGSAAFAIIVGGISLIVILYLSIISIINWLQQIK